MKLNVLVAIFIFSLSFWSVAKNPISAQRLNKLSGNKDQTYDTKSEWDQKYSRPSFVFGKTPVKFLAENFDFIPEGSKVLDVGMGEGRNAVFLAKKGHSVTGIDISSVAIKKSYLLAKEFDVRIKGITASLDKYKFEKESFDAIICFYYVDRKLTKKMMSWLRPGGILIYEAHTLKQRRKAKYSKDPKSYFLKSQELLKMFKVLRVLKYEEPLHEKSFRASAILQKRQRK